MATPVLRGGASAPLSLAADEFARRVIEQIELEALDTRLDTMSFGGQVASRVAAWFAEANLVSPVSLPVAEVTA